MNPNKAKVSSHLSSLARKRLQEEEKQNLRFIHVCEQQKHTLDRHHQKNHTHTGIMHAPHGHTNMKRIRSNLGLT
jgi:hypothetical protein